LVHGSPHRVVIIQNQTAGCLRVVARFNGPSVMAVNLRVITKSENEIYTK
jgi:hypothetical protein